MENQFAQQMPLAKRLFIARYQGEKEIIKLQQFPKLQELATNVVADNYSLYPELEGVPLRIRNNVWLFVLLMFSDHRQGCQGS